MSRPRFFLVERYVPSTSVATLEAAVARLGDPPDPATRHVLTVLVAGEDTCLSIFEAPTATAVEAANRHAGFPFDRVARVRRLG
jgi:Protein of unknown function (DUF4242)